VAGSNWPRCRRGSLESMRLAVADFAIFCAMLAVACLIYNSQRG
jgi:hypothetical protein